jgi:hypothetical protein
MSGNAVRCVEIRASQLDIHSEWVFGTHDELLTVRQFVRIHASEALYSRRSLNFHPRKPF